MAKSMTRQWSSAGGHQLHLVSLVVVTLLALAATIANCSSIKQQSDVRQVIFEINMESAQGIRRPAVIGVLTQVLRDYKRFTKQHHLHIASSYIKWIESAGAQALPILLNQDDAYYERVFRQTNGLLLTGGDNLLDPTKHTPMMVAAKKLYKLAVRANERGDYYPIWGTCLGLELLSVLTANRNVLEECSANDDALPIEFVQRGKLFAPARYADLPLLSSDYSGAIVSALSSHNLTYNFHHKCLTDVGLGKAGLTNFYRPLAYSKDKNGLKFIAIFESVKYPFFGVQFHPEKPPFEWVIKKSQQHIPHSRESIAVSRYFADFFVQQAQLSSHKADPKSLQDELIYAHHALYTAPMHDMYEQRYLFPFGLNSSASTEEFMEHVPDEDEDAPEDVSEAGKAGQVAVLRESEENEINFMQQDDGLIAQVDTRALYIMAHEE